MNRKEILAPYPVQMEFPIAWGDMDAYQHLNNIIYFRYFECARIKYFEQIGLIESKETQQIGGILGETSCRFKAPVRYPDTITTTGRTIDVLDDRFVMEYVIVSHELGRMAAQGTGTVVCYDYAANKKCSLPPELVDAIRTLESSST